ncbi:2-C-methyl-D-erythritol 4-phosphate cytidylyltransferase [Haloferula sp. BvORR071]|uniref:2-C-methyl-D-erythritol 4-phosphate cytidylyltransferase n=1 Tax=Haloferula sp. BvORR071 TaxID=1396141 RepID=UPI000552BF24|nr:2-C-methyl-D-erythritol 4-phosphate cytidylyltransferase [Haloferula sp. BvORR071]
MRCAAVIVAAGSSRRMGFDKLAAEIRGVSVLRRSVDAFMATPEVTRVIVVAPQERFAALGTGLPKPLLRADGGKERQNSVENGLALVEEELVAVHDGARPLVTPQAISTCISEAGDTGAATLARQVTETIKRADADDFARESVSRELLWFMETPQIFRTALLRQAYATVREKGLIVTDEVSAMEAIGVFTKLVASPSPNLKITVPADIELATALLR